MTGGSRPGSDNEDVSDSGDPSQSSPGTTDGVVRVVIADDQTLMRQGLRSLLEVSEDDAVVGAAAHGAEALGRVAGLAPDVLMVDLRGPGRTGCATLEAHGARGA